jgi:hypothetical protein
MVHMNKNLAPSGSLQGVFEFGQTRNRVLMLNMVQVSTKVYIRDVSSSNLDWFTVYPALSFS